MRLDGLRPDPAELAERLAAFWIPSRTVVYIGQTAATVGGRLRSYYKTPLGDRRPHAGGHWIKTLACLEDCLVWWAPTGQPHATETALLESFASTVSAAEARRLHDPMLVLPFANLEDGSKARKGHGVSRATLR